MNYPLLSSDNKTCCILIQHSCRHTQLDTLGVNKMGGAEQSDACKQGHKPTPVKPTSGTKSGFSEFAATAVTLTGIDLAKT